MANFEEAFASLPIPADAEIVYDNSPEHLECAEIRLWSRPSLYPSPPIR
ncbi:MAG: hypothetical protein SX243_23865 [Acidobacteriota bacterium]|nr:hypothetical protein [Acidobacteriota bacterium]